MNQRRPLLLALLLVAATASGTLAADSDGDGLRDHFETKYGVTSPHTKDSDKDGVVDSAEDSDGDKLGNLAEQRFKLDPSKRDTDGDGRNDGAEDHDGDGRKNKFEQYQIRVPRDLKPSLAQATSDDGAGDGCNARNGESTPKRCWYGPTGTGRRVVLMGDSHAKLLTGPFKRAANADAFRLVTYLKGGCIPVLGTMSAGQYEFDGGRSCRDWRLNVIKAIKARPPDLLVITASATYKLVDSGGAAILGSRRVTKWREGMKRLIDKMPSRTDILVLGDVPRNRVHPVRCLSRNRADMSRCTSRWIAPSKRRVHVALQRAVAEKGERYATLYGKICPTDPCPLVQGRTMMWRDRSHLSGTMARKLTPSVRAILQTNLDR